MIEADIEEVKPRLTQLLDRVAKGDRVMITRHGKPIAMLVPPETPVDNDVAGIVRDMLLLRDKQGPKLGRGMSIRKLVDQGRRF